MLDNEEHAEREGARSDLPAFGDGAADSARSSGPKSDGRGDASSADPLPEVRHVMICSDPSKLPPNASDAAFWREFLIDDETDRRASRLIARDGHGQHETGSAQE